MTFSAFSFRTLTNLPLLLGGALLVLAVNMPAFAEGGIQVSGTRGNAGISIAKAHRYADVILDTDEITGAFSINIRNDDLGKEGDLFLAVMIDGGQVFMKTPDGWRPWDMSIENLQPVATRKLGATEVISLADSQRLPAGDYWVAAAYATTGKLVTGPGLHFQVNAANAGTLQRFASAEAMAAYIREGMINANDSSALMLKSSITFASADAAEAGLARVSTTNLQETGVDEADIIKTDGSNLFALNNCITGYCLDVYALDGVHAVADKTAAYALDNTVAPDGMYLVKDLPGSDLLVTVAGQNRFIAWFDIRGWSGNTTEIEFFDADRPDNLVSLEKLTINGSLVSSRRVGDTLYVVTRYTPYVEDFDPKPVVGPGRNEQVDALEEKTLSDLVPHVTDAGKQVQDLIDAGNCFLPVTAVDRNNDPSIITVTSLSLSDPGSFASTCFLGGTETVYMTSDSLYLATTRWEYQTLAADALVYNPDHTTAVHKFALANGGVDYRGSAEVKGHMGWDEDKKSFRMGENGAYLNIVTSIGDTWSGDSSTRLTVLREAASGDGLETVSVMDGIGKPGEQLYAARFLGNRAYLVTFRLIDPLYVVDLSDQEHPRFAGELEIDGYSDYLHPVSENLLLGIGKDAVPDDRATDFEGARGAWYQGLKLSLFDVADPAHPREVDSLVLGKRGTESAALWDHHAVTFLPAAGNEPARLAIPVQLHDTTPDWKDWDGSNANAWYDFTHTGLYTFEISALGISQAGAIISEKDNGDDFIISLADDVILDTDKGNSDGTDSADPDVPVDVPVRLIMPIFNSYNDRSVLLDDAVFYLHDGEVLSAFWGEDADATD